MYIEKIERIKKNFPDLYSQLINEIENFVTNPDDSTSFEDYVKYISLVSFYCGTINAPTLMNELI